MDLGNLKLFKMAMTQMDCAAQRQKSPVAKHRERGYAWIQAE